MSTISMHAEGDETPGVDPLDAAFDVEVVTPEAANASLTIGTPELKPVPAPEAAPASAPAGDAAPAAGDGSGAAAGADGTGATGGGAGDGAGNAG